jgi:hypothetical protein
MEHTTAFSPAVACITSTSGSFQDAFDPARRCFPGRMFFYLNMKEGHGERFEEKPDSRRRRL